MSWRNIKIFFFIIGLIIIAGFTVYSFSSKPQQIQVASIVIPDKQENELEKKLKTLTLDQKIGQLFMIGFKGKIFTPEIENLIKKIHPGGILLLERNVEDKKQLKELIDSLQKTALEDVGLPLFIAVDQEGGPISRIDWINKTPQSEIFDSEQSYQIGIARGEALKELGVNLNLAPLLDETKPSDFIFERSFQKNNKTIGELAKSLIIGQKASIFSAVKHFPGYGKISFNPEEKLATIDKIPDFSQFEKAIEASPEMVMVSNVIYRDLNKELPFSFLPDGVNFLKEKIKGDYLIISDDLDQNSLLDKFSLEEIVTFPFNAGNDILIFSGWRLPVINGVAAFKKAVEENKISSDRIDRSVLKIINLKQKILD